MQPGAMDRHLDYHMALSERVTRRGVFVFIYTMNPELQKLYMLTFRLNYLVANSRRRGPQS